MDIRGIKTSGESFVIEVKPSRWLKDRVNQEKIRAVKVWALENGSTFAIWTEEDLFESERDARQYALDLRSRLSGVDQSAIQREADRRRQKRHYDNVIKEDRVQVTCECGNCDGETVFDILRVVYNKNVAKNGHYINKECSDRKSKNRGSRLIDENGMKPCSGPCGRTLPLDRFSISNGKTGKRCSQCKECM